ncbi:MAG: acyl-CoA dehydrogenase [Phycisphaerae bacterium]|nr:acyl-CoA dehydrogenase [Phycisphaerae bacterium]MBM92128.1 acyl-CoA dehydrogenase [Phycisphaerae bacterium]HCT44292.1 acyl-CoA dehydrogenase [Phycisphaerales bacterium]
MAETTKADLKNMKGVSERDKQMIADAEQLLGPEPSTMGAVKNLFWGNFREELYFPYPEIAKNSPEETAECDRLVAELEDYLKNEHPSIEIDQKQYIPERVIQRLFDMGVLGMTIGKDFGGLGMGITSYNRVLETIGKYCGSTAVMVSAHQSIGCKAVMLFGTDEQKQRWLPKLAREWLSAFCLSEPQVGCDAGGQETTIELSEDGEHYIVNGEKKWATSGAISGLFTVMGKQTIDGKQRVTSVVCTPDMEGIDIFSKNRSKMCIRGTWQARIRFTNVKVPKANLLHKEGRGLNVALTCLNYGRCTLSAGMLGGAKKAMDQSIKWAQTRYQFSRPLSDFELVQQKIARMSAYCYAMDSVLYMTTGMLDRHDDDIMLETAICKVFCSEFGWRTVNDAVQIVGGEGTMTENELERIFRDSRINTIVEGANEVMQSFIFAYGGKQLAEQMLGIKEMADNKKFTPTMLRAAIPLGMEVFLGMRKKAPSITKVDASLRGYADRLAKLITELTYQFKVISKKKDAAIVTAQATQARLADVAMYLHAWSCTLSRLDCDMRNGESGTEFERNKASAIHFFDLAELAIHQSFRELHENADDTMLKAADLALAHSSSLPNSDYYIPESSPTAKGTGKEHDQDHIVQFPGTGRENIGANGREHMEQTISQL